MYLRIEHRAKGKLRVNIGRRGMLGSEGKLEVNIK
jgi:hypothetical protein